MVKRTSFEIGAKIVKLDRGQRRHDSIFFSPFDHAFFYPSLFGLTEPHGKRTSLYVDSETGTTKIVEKRGSNGAAFRTWREMKDLTLTDVARLTGTSIGHLSGIERGKSDPSLDLCRRLASAYEITVSDLFTRFPNHSGSGQYRADDETTATE